MKPVQSTIETQPIPVWLRGAIAGFVGTAPMTVFMLATQRFLPKGQRYALPPEIITQELAHRAHIRYRMNKMQILGATLVSHFGYGTVMGALYTPFARKIPLHAAIKGMLFGLLVWLGSYFALLPLLGLWESAYTEPTRRNLLMIAAHVVWGASTGATAEVLIRTSQRNSQQAV